MTCSRPALPPFALASLALALALSTAACGKHADFPLHFAGDLAISAAILTDAQPTRVVVVHEVAPPVAAPIDGSPAPAGFDPAQARAAVEAVDVAECWAPGSTHGMGVARVTFHPSGTVGLVEVTNPVDGASLDAACMARKYGSLRVTPYSGAPIAVTANIIVG
jgi:hypothetical protein